MKKIKQEPSKNAEAPNPVFVVMMLSGRLPEKTGMKADSSIGCRFLPCREIFQDFQTFADIIHRQ